MLRQHLRRWLPDLVGLLHDFWGAGPGVLPVLLELVAELASEACICIGNPYFPGSACTTFPRDVYSYMQGCLSTVFADILTT